VRIIVSRNNQDFGPYSLATAQQYLSQGTLLPHDLARDAAVPGAASLPLGQFLASHGMAAPSAGSGNPFSQAYQNLRSFDLKLLFPWSTISSAALF